MLHIMEIRGSAFNESDDLLFASWAPWFYLAMCTFSHTSTLPLPLDGWFVSTGSLHTISTVSTLHVAALLCIIISSHGRSSATKRGSHSFCAH